jgi:histidinol-phosphate/aromatic aminotransferase/cobyric acid decarboxylase-like protein
MVQTSDPEKMISRLRDRGIHVRDRSYLPQLEGFVRITIGTEPQMRRVLEALSELRP